MAQRPNKLDPHAADLDRLLAKPEFGGEGRTYAEAAAWLAARGLTKADGRPVNPGQIHAWWAPRRKEFERRRALKEYMLEAKAQAESLAHAPGLSGRLFLQAGLLQIGALVMKLTQHGSADPETIRQVKDLYHSLVAGVREMRGGEELQLTREKFEELKRRAARDEQTERVVDDAQLTPEERAQRIKEIFGRA